MSSPRMLTLALLVAAIALPACGSSTEDSCKKSRDLYLAYSEKKIQETLESFHADEAAERAELDEKAHAELETARGAFVEHCKATDAATRKCLARIEELAAIQETMEKEIMACPRDDVGLPDAACQDRAKEKANAAVGACGDKITAFANDLYDTAE